MHAPGRARVCGCGEVHLPQLAPGGGTLLRGSSWTTGEDRMAIEWELGARSWKLGAGSYELGAGSWELGAMSVSPDTGLGDLCPKIMCFVHLYRLWIYFRNMVKLPKFWKMFFYQISTFHCPCLTTDHIGTSVLGEIMHFSFGLMMYNYSVSSLSVILTAIVTSFKKNYDRRS